MEETAFWLVASDAYEPTDLLQAGASLHGTPWEPLPGLAAESSRQILVLSPLWEHTVSQAVNPYSPLLWALLSITNKSTCSIGI